LNLLYFIKLNLISLELDIFYIFEFGAEASQTGIQVEYTPLEILLLYYLLLLVGAGVARAGATRTVGCRSRAGMVACLQATADAFLTPLLAAALSIFYDASVGVVGGQGSWCSRALATAAALVSLAAAMLRQ
jgi:hypothetical protein